MKGVLLRSEAEPANTPLVEQARSKVLKRFYWRLCLRQLGPVKENRWFCAGFPASLLPLCSLLRLAAPPECRRGTPDSVALIPA
jgi:hypothetical protein